jgi:hypothetical protein
MSSSNCSTSNISSFRTITSSVCARSSVNFCPQLFQVSSEDRAQRGVRIIIDRPGRRPVPLRRGCQRFQFHGASVAPQTAGDGPPISHNHSRPRCIQPGGSIHSCPHERGPTYAPTDPASAMPARLARPDSRPKATPRRARSPAPKQLSLPHQSHPQAMDAQQATAQQFSVWGAPKTSMPPGVSRSSDWLRRRTPTHSARHLMHAAIRIDPGPRGSSPSTRPLRHVVDASVEG